MKKLFLFLPILITACADTGFNSRQYNEKCESVKELEVFQTLNDGALAFVCERKSYDDCAMGHTVFVEKQRGVEFWDKKRIKAPKDKCIVFDGVYKYTSKDERERTIPVARFEYEYSVSSEDELVDRMTELHGNLFDACLDEANAEFKNNKEQNKKTCECFADLTMENIINMMTTEQDLKSEIFTKEFIKNAEKKCGKLPKSIKN